MTVHLRERVRRYHKYAEKKQIRSAGEWGGGTAVQAFLLSGALDQVRPRTMYMLAYHTWERTYTYSYEF